MKNDFPLLTWQCKLHCFPRRFVVGPGGLSTEFRHAIEGQRFRRAATLLERSEFCTSTVTGNARAGTKEIAEDDPPATHIIRGD